jgi:hypothetical protein
VELPEEKEPIGFNEVLLGALMFIDLKKVFLKKIQILLHKSIKSLYLSRFFIGYWILKRD